jgi:hypothetical protein
MELLWSQIRTYCCNDIVNKAQLRMNVEANRQHTCGLFLIAFLSFAGFAVQ